MNAEAIVLAELDAKMNAEAIVLAELESGRNSIQLANALSLLTSLS
jgi:hypothetical protein